MAAQHQILNIKEISNDISDSGNDKIKIKYTYQKNKLQKPRRNKSAFILFSNEARNQIKADEGNLNSNEMMVKLAARWKNLSKEESERYKLMAKNDKIRYQQELVNFAKLHPDETIHNKTKNNHVKKPCSAYGMFLREKKDLIKKQNPNLKMADILKLVSQDWKNLSEAQKKVYKDRAGVEKEEVRNKLCEAIIRDQTTKKTSTIPQSKGSKKVKKSPVAPVLPDVPENLEATAVKTEDTMTLNHRNSSDLWPRFDETTLPLTLINEPSDIQIKTETLLEPEKKPSTIPLFSSTTSLDLMLNQSLFTKKQDSNINFNTATNNGADPGLLSLLSRQVQKPNELLADILNFDINFDNIKSVNLLETSLFKLKSESRNSISQFLNLSQARPAAPSRARILNETIMNVLDDQGSKDSFFEDPIAALEKKNLS